MYQRGRLKRSVHRTALLAVVSIIGVSGVAGADVFSVCTGAGCSTTNVAGSIVAGNGTVTLEFTNLLSSSQVVSASQNPSAVYFEVSGYNGGAVSLFSSVGAMKIIVDSDGEPAFAGPGTPTGWTAGSSGQTIAVCVVCAFGISPGLGPDLTLIGGTGTSDYDNADSSIAGNASNNPFLAGTLTFLVTTPGVTESSTFSNVVVQFGTTPPSTPTPTNTPTNTPNPLVAPAIPTLSGKGSVVLILLLGSLAVVALLRSRG